MSRHPRYLELPWGIEGGYRTKTSGYHLWWLIVALCVLAVFFIGVRVTSGVL